jgi:hypothetical protein
MSLTFSLSVSLLLWDKFSRKVRDWPELSVLLLQVLELQVCTTTLSFRTSFLCMWGDTQGLLLARQALYLLSHTSSRRTSFKGCFEAKRLGLYEEHKNPMCAVGVRTPWPKAFYSTSSCGWWLEEEDGRRLLLLPEALGLKFPPSLLSELHLLYP